MRDIRVSSGVCDSVSETRRLKPRDNLLLLAVLISLAGESCLISYNFTFHKGLFKKTEETEQC